jgi:hypothetical protein
VLPTDLVSERGNVISTRESERGQEPTLRECIYPHLHYQRILERYRTAGVDVKQTLRRVGGNGSVGRVAPHGGRVGKDRSCGESRRSIATQK